MEKQIFKVGDRVFDIRFGWGEVEEINNEDKYPVKVKFSAIAPRYFKNGIINEIEEVSLLSFTEYTLQDFSQERPINYEDYIGKWGKFWDYKDEEFSSFTIDKLLKYNKEKGHFVLRDGDRYVYSNYFKPLTEEQIKILGLE